ncbi:MAG: hypothetical protein AB7V45_14110 [Candidatus Krumholzibacteriia bacterium]
MKTAFVSLFIIAMLTPGASSLANPIPLPWCGWENGETVLFLSGTGDPPILVSNVPNPAPDPVSAGTFSLRLEDNSPSGTPYAAIATIYDLNDGDQVTVGFWRYDTTPGSSPSCRIWAHWNDSLPDDPLANDGSASGNLDYGPGLGWDYTSYTWTVVEGHTGLVIEARTYSDPGDVVWIDNLDILPPDDCTIVSPCWLIVDTEQTSLGAVKALYR